MPVLYPPNIFPSLNHYFRKCFQTININKSFFLFGNLFLNFYMQIYINNSYYGIIRNLISTNNNKYIVTLKLNHVQILLDRVRAKVKKPEYITFSCQCYLTRAIAYSGAKRPQLDPTTFTFKPKFSVSSFQKLISN